MRLQHTDAAGEKHILHPEPVRTGKNPSFRIPSLSAPTRDDGLPSVHVLWVEFPSCLSGEMACDRELIALPHELYMTN